MRKLTLPFFFAHLMISIVGAELPRDESWWPKASPLPQPTGRVIRISTVDELFKATRELEAGTTVFLADGVYQMPAKLDMAGDRVSLRGASGDRRKVILDFSTSRHGEGIGIRGGEGALVADLTVRNVKWNGIKISSELGAQRVTIHNCILHNVWQRGVKAPHIPPHKSALYPRACRIQFCLFYNDRPKRFSDDETDTPKNYNGNYIGGIDVKNTHGWTISDNVFMKINGRTGEGRGAIYISEEGHDCLIERNVFIDCDVGIALGNPSLGGDWLHCIDCVARNNLVTRCNETGILACHTKNCLITHNTVHDPKAPRKRLLFLQFANKALTVTNNLFSGPPPNVMTQDAVSFRDNVAVPDLGSLFRNPLAGDLRLAKPDPRIIDRCRRQIQVSHDFSHQPRLDQPDAGADEFQIPRSRKASVNAFVATTPSQSADPKKTKPAAKAATPLGLAWVDSMRKAHAKFKGKAGRVAQLGDSITYSMAFWSPLGWSDPTSFLTDDGLPKHPKNKRWRDWVVGTRDKGSKFGNYSGWRVGNALKAIDEVIRRDQPEVAIVMLGTNDIAGGKVPQGYEAGLEQIVDKCLAVGCVPILNTIPPRRDREEVVHAANAIIRKLTARKKIPLADFHAAIVERRPGNSWDGTLISKDGVHPSGGKTQDYSPENLKTCGYALRNWVNFLALRQVYFRVLHPEEAR